MKRRGILIGLCLLLVAATQAQSVADDLEQLSLDIQKLSELKSVLSDMKQGYTIISQGYEKVKQIAQGNFNLHEAFLDGLWLVSPVVRNDKRIAYIINDQLQIVSSYKSQYSALVAGKHFSDKELGYIMTVYNNLVTGSLNNLTELTTILSDNQVRMSDDERLSTIERLYKDMQAKLIFLHSFNDRAALMSLQRQHSQNEIQELANLYHLQN
jgi:hypothetical protein